MGEQIRSAEEYWAMYSELVTIAPVDADPSGNWRAVWRAPASPLYPAIVLDAYGPDRGSAVTSLYTKLSALRAAINSVCSGGGDDARFQS